MIEPGLVKNNWGKHCVVGSRICNEEFYKKLTHGICQMLSISQGQTSEEIAALLVEISQTAEPNVPYQTNSGMKEWIA